MPVAIYQHGNEVCDTEISEEMYERPSVKQGRKELQHQSLNMKVLKQLKNV